MTLYTKSEKELHPVGVGTWLIGGSWSAEKRGELWGGSAPAYGHETEEAEAIRYAITQGQNHIDTAELYGVGHTEEVVAQAIRGLNREDLYVADKLWRNHVAAGTVRPAVEAMLKRLGTSYIDLLYIHWPWDNWQAAVPQIDELIDAGLVRQFGVSNFQVREMQEALQLAKHPLAANQMNYNVLHKDEANDELREFCRQHDIQLVAYQPVKRGEVLGSKAIQEIADAHQATPSQVALAWLIQQGALPIPKSTSKQHIDENRAAAELRLSEAEIASLNDL